MSASLPAGFIKGLLPPIHRGLAGPQCLCNRRLRLIIFGGLARFGGLCCPSEVLRLKWQDIDFDQLRFKVHASKTEHHADSGIRTVPMFPELKPLFQDAFDNAREGAVYCIERYRDSEVNLRTQLSRIIKKAELEPWPKLFQNCRSTRETELFKMTGGNIKAVCTWLGDSPAVAMNHYAQTTETDMKEAAKKSVLNQAGKDILNLILPANENGCNSVQDGNTGEEKTLHNFTETQGLTAICNDLQNADHWAVQDLNL